MELSEITALLQAGRYAELAQQAVVALERQPESGMDWKALSVALSMQGIDALEASRQAARLMPADAETHANLGNALLRAGRAEQAAASYSQALSIDPHAADVHNNLGTALRVLGKADAAVLSYRRALEISPAFAEAHSNLGNALRSVGQLEAAVASYRRALEIRPDYPEALNNLGNALLDLKRYAEAAACYGRALELDPSLAEAHNNLGNAMQGLGDIEEAAACYRRALARKPEFAQAHSNLGNVLRELGRAAEAWASALRAVELAPASAAAHVSLANVCMDLGKLAEAEDGYRRALALDARSTDAWIDLGLLQRQRGLNAEAEACAREALKVVPTAAAFVLLGELRADAGDFAAAESMFRRAVAVDADATEGWAGIAQVRRATAADAQWLRQAMRLAAQPLAPRREVSLRFALGKYFDETQDFAQAFDNFRRAHALVRTFNAPYDRERQAHAADRITRIYDAVWAAGVRRPRSTSRAVFIVGMPRSGTTLLEQILAAHPAVHGAGELSYWDEAQRLPSAHERGEAYLELLAAASRGAERVIDKMPTNFWHLGSIHAALPEAKVIHIRRDPVDTCLSIYFQHFKNPPAYADDLKDLAHYYGLYERLMQHFRTVLPESTLLEVPYEGLVEAQEQWSRRIVEHVGLEWDPACLNFHQAGGSVRTASKWQVRQKLNHASIRRWKNYEAFIAPLLTLHPRN